MRLRRLMRASLRSIFNNNFAGLRPLCVLSNYFVEDCLDQSHEENAAVAGGVIRG